MKKLPIFSYLITLMFIGLLGYLYFTNIEPFPAPKKQEAPEEINPIIQDNKSITNVLLEATAMGKSIECFYESDALIIGKAYTKNKQFLTVTTVEGKLVSALAKEKCVWIWEENNSQGVKMCFEKEFWEGSSEQNFELIPEGSEYSCNAANSSDSLFEPPATINFLDITEQNNNSPLQENP